MSIQMKDVSKVFVTAGIENQAISHMDLVINDNDFTMIVGPARSGKSTLLNLMSGVVLASEGDIQILDKHISHMSERELEIFRDLNIGFVYKHYKLLESTNIKENIFKQSIPGHTYLDIAQVLEQTHLSHAADKYPFQLANGEQQKVVIAREIIKKPKYLFCDDPTGAFSKATTILVLDVLIKITKFYHIPCIMTTQNEKLSVVADRIIYLNHGKIVKDEINENIKEAKDIQWY